LPLEKVTAVLVPNVPSDFSSWHTNLKLLITFPYGFPCVAVYPTATNPVGQLQSDVTTTGALGHTLGVTELFSCGGSEFVVCEAAGLEII
jgi:hypothetical protein